jgi:hypothetical protein
MQALEIPSGSGSWRQRCMDVALQEHHLALFGVVPPALYQRCLPGIHGRRQAGWPVWVLPL